MRKGDVKEVKFDLKLLRDPTKIDIDKDLFGEASEVSRRIANARADAVKKDLAWFYVHLYTWVLGGIPERRYKMPVETSRNGNSRNYHPDVLHREHGRVWDDEVKSFNRSYVGSVPVAHRQFENYISHLLGKLDNAHEAGRNLERYGFNYGFFRYYVPTKTIMIKDKGLSSYKKKKIWAGKKPASMKPKELVDFATQSVRDLIVVPPNLLMFLFMNYRFKIMNQESSDGNLDSQDYWIVKSGDLSALHHPETRGIDELFDLFHPIVEGKGRKAHLEEIRRILYLDRLKVEQFMSPKIVVNGKYEIEPFPVTRYKFRTAEDYREWGRDLLRTHKSLLVDRLRIRDLYQEGKDVPI